MANTLTLYSTTSNVSLLTLLTPSLPSRPVLDDFRRHGSGQPRNQKQPQPAGKQHESHLVGGLVSTQLKNMIVKLDHETQIFGVKITKNVLNHHLVTC